METNLKLERLTEDKRWENFEFCVITCSLRRLTLAWLWVIQINRNVQCMYTDTAKYNYVKDYVN